MTTMSEFEIKSQDGPFLADPGQIVRVEHVSRVMEFTMADGTVYTSIYIRQSFEAELETLLADSHFIQPHKSFVVNMDYVAEVTPREFVMTDGAVVPISRNNEDVKKRYLEYLTQVGRSAADGPADGQDENGL